MNSSIREILKDKKRIVIKIGSSSLTHPETGALNLTKLEVLVREISDLHNMGKDVIVVSSGAIAVGRRAAGLGHRPSETGHTDDDLSEAFFGIQSAGSTDPDDQTYRYGQSESF